MTLGTTWSNNNWSITGKYYIRKCRHFIWGKSKGMIVWNIESTGLWVRRWEPILGFFYKKVKEGKRFGISSEGSLNLFVLSFVTLKRRDTELLRFFSVSKIGSWYSNWHALKWCLKFANCFNQSRSNFYRGQNYKNNVF